MALYFGNDYIKTVGVSFPSSGGIDTSDANATSADILEGQTAYVQGQKVVGSLVVQKFYTGSSAPDSSLGQEGDLYLKV